MRTFRCDPLQVSAMTKHTQDIMARAQEQSNAADAQAAELQRVRLRTADYWHQVPGGCLHILYRLKPSATGCVHLLQPAPCGSSWKKQPCPSIADVCMCCKCLVQAKEQIAATEQQVGASREALSAAVAEQRSLEGGARATAENVETYAQVRRACCYVGWSCYKEPLCMSSQISLHHASSLLCSV